MKPRRHRSRLALTVLAGLALTVALAPAAFAVNEGDADQSSSGNRPPHRLNLTDEQRQCLQDQGLEKPARGEDGKRVKPTDEQREAFRQAAEACGIELPAKPNRPKLTDEQRQCLQDQGLEKPARGEDGKRVKPTDEQREAFRQAAEACGIELPAKPSEEAST